MTMILHGRRLLALMLAILAGFILPPAAQAQTSSLDDPGTIPRFGVMTWAPVMHDPDFAKTSNGYPQFESDVFFGSSFRTTGLKRTGTATSGESMSPSFEYEFQILDQSYIDHSGAGWIINCDLPNCKEDNYFEDTSDQVAVLTGSPQLINANGVYDITMAAIGYGSGSPIEIRATAGSYRDNCLTQTGYDVPECAFGDYILQVNKPRHLSAPNNYGRFWSTAHQHLLENTSFGSCLNLWQIAGIISAACHQSSSADTPNFIRLHTSSLTQRPVLYQNQLNQVRATEDYSIEAVVRCVSTSDTGCDINLIIEGRGGPSADEIFTSNKFSLPENQDWYLCRLQHTSGNAFGPRPRFAGTHSTLRGMIMLADTYEYVDVDSVIVTPWQNGDVLNQTTSTDRNACNRVAIG